MEGEVFSPILFSLYVNDIESSFLRENCPSIDIHLINIFLLMYADEVPGYQNILANIELHVNCRYRLVLSVFVYFSL